MATNDSEHFSTKLDNALKSYFYKREDIPLATREALRKKLYAAQDKEQDKLRWLWFLVPHAIIAAVLLLTATTILFGWLATIIAFVGYYIIVTISATIAFAALLKNNEIRKVNFT